MANDILRLDNINVDAIYVRGLCLYNEDNVDKAFTHFQQVLRLAPDHTKAEGGRYTVGKLSSSSIFLEVSRGGFVSSETWNTGAEARGKRHSCNSLDSRTQKPKETS